MFFKLSFKSCYQLKNNQFKFNFNFQVSTWYIEIKIISHSMLVSRKILLLTLYDDEISRVRSKLTPVWTCIAFIISNSVNCFPSSTHKHKRIRQFIVTDYLHSISWADHYGLSIRSIAGLITRPYRDHHILYFCSAYLKTLDTSLIHPRT